MKYMVINCDLCFEERVCRDMRENIYFYLEVWVYVIIILKIVIMCKIIEMYRNNWNMIFIFLGV